jgi:hypothetical protein
MLANPFTPSDIASQPQDFFGRGHELRQMERSLMQGSVAIQGPIGIGKSSLLARTRLHMEGFDSSHRSLSSVATGHKDITSVDEAARLLLQSFVDVDEVSNRIRFNLAKIVEIESAEICRYFAEGRHLAGLIKLMEQRYLNMVLADQELLILAIDEADKCPVPLTRLIRTLITHIQQIGVRNVRFVIAGVTPYFQKMIDEDQGIGRFFYKVLSLTPMSMPDASELIEQKFLIVVKDARENKINLKIDPSIIDKVTSLSGGHPHILQLMGSHIVENENDNPDGIIDSRDLVNSLRTICYENRVHVYESAIHYLELYNQLDNLKTLLASASSNFPTRLDRKVALSIVEPSALDWFVKNNYFTVLNDDDYGLIDEFLRIRLIIDEDEAESAQIERRMIETGAIRKPSRDEFMVEERNYYSDEEFDPTYEDED